MPQRSGCARNRESAHWAMPSRPRCGGCLEGLFIRGDPGRHQVASRWVRVGATCPGKRKAEMRTTQVRREGALKVVDPSRRKHARQGRQLPPAGLSRVRSETACRPWVVETHWRASSGRTASRWEPHEDGPRTKKNVRGHHNGSITREGDRQGCVTKTRCTHPPSTAGEAARAMHGAAPRAALEAPARRPASPPPASPASRSWPRCTHASAARRP